jgi:hypothetical protein
MRKRRCLLALSAVGLLLLAVSGAPGSPARAASPTFYTDRAAFEAALAATITDYYGTPPYPEDPDGGWYNDATFSAFFDQTDYQATGWPGQNMNNHGPGDWYCAGCNGSFLLSFQTTSMTLGGTGVYGVGLDILKNTSLVPYYAFITYGDGPPDDIALPVVVWGNPSSFFGVIAPELIESIHFGLSGGGTTTDVNGSFAIDNLTIGSKHSHYVPLSLYRAEG